MDVLKQRQFGIEIELSRQLMCVNYTNKSYSHAYNEVRTLLSEGIRSKDLVRGWVFKIDTSCGGEIVSPILRDPKKGLAQIAYICDGVRAIAKRYGKPAVDGECGLHLHFDTHGISPKQLSNLFILVHTAEPIIYAMYPGRNFGYCAPIEVSMRQASRFRDMIDVRDVWYRGSNNVKNRKAMYSEDFVNSTNPGESYDGTRYHGFNIHCFWRQGTVEFRYGKGTIDPLHIKAYYEMCLAMVNTATLKKHIKLSDSIKDMKFHVLNSHFQNNHRFRKLIKALCKECQFSRNTVKLIMDLIGENKPRLLDKKIDESCTIINKSNCGKFYYKNVADNAYYDFNGKKPGHNTILAKIATGIKIVNVSLDVGARKRGNSWCRAISVDKEFYIKYQLYLPLTPQQMAAINPTAANPTNTPNFEGNF